MKSGIVSVQITLETLRRSVEGIAEGLAEVRSLQEAESAASATRTPVDSVSSSNSSISSSGVSSGGVGGEGSVPGGSSADEREPIMGTAAEQFAERGNREGSGAAVTPLNGANPQVWAS